MSEEAGYIRERLDDVLRGQSRLEDKIDRMREEQVSQRSAIVSTNKQLDEHHKILVIGNGQKALTVQLAEANTRIEDVENDIHAVRKTGKVAEDPASVRKERLVFWGKCVAFAGLIVSQVLTWILAIPGGK